MEGLGWEEGGASVVGSGLLADVGRGMEVSSEGSESVEVASVWRFGGLDWELGRYQTIGSSSFCASLASAGCIGSLLFSLFLPLKSFFVAGVAAASALVFLQTAITHFMIDFNIFVRIGV